MKLGQVAWIFAVSEDVVLDWCHRGKIAAAQWPDGTWTIPSSQFAVTVDDVARDEAVATRLVMEMNGGLNQQASHATHITAPADHN